MRLSLHALMRLASPAAADTFEPPTILERVITLSGIDRRSELKRRPVTEREVEAVLLDSGDLEAYRAGRMSKHEAHRQTVAVLKAQGQLRGGIVQ